VDEAQAAGALGSLACFYIIYFAVIALWIVGMWKVYLKANKPGWAAIIPIYNIIVLLELAGRPGWWVILYFIPIVNIIVLAIVSIDVAASFGKGVGYGIGLWLLPFIFYLMLGFGSAQYQGPAAAQGQTPQAPPPQY
jgi:hypothetical protein